MLFVVFVQLLQLTLFFHMGFKFSGGAVAIDLHQLIFSIAEDIQQIVVVYIYSPVLTDLLIVVFFENIVTC